MNHNILENTFINACRMEAIWSQLQGYQDTNYIQPNTTFMGTGIFFFLTRILPRVYI